MSDIQNLVRLRIYETSTRAREGKLIDHAVHNKRTYSSRLNIMNIVKLQITESAIRHFLFTASPRETGDGVAHVRAKHTPCLEEILEYLIPQCT